MYIQEAVKKAKESDRFITRLSTPEIKILTVGGLPCIIMHRDGSNKKSGWNPTQRDLLADDWVVCE